MSTLRKRLKVTSACKRCRERKLGCDPQRPCQLCTRAGVECIPRHSSVVPPEDSGVEESRKDESTPQLESHGPVVLPESTIVDLSTLIFRGVGPGQTVSHDTSALPGGRKQHRFDPAGGTRQWRNLVGVVLPPDDGLEELVGSFFLSVDWFMMVFHEEAFRQRFRDLLRQRQIPCHDANFHWLCMLVVALGAHYAALSPSPNPYDIDYRRLSRELIANIEARFLQIVGCSTLETVQICILLGSFFLFNERPNTGLGISGSGVKIAQVIGLHRETLWKETCPIVREEKRRTWWALEVFDKYAAISFGRPCIIDDSDCDVGMVSHVPLEGQKQAENPLLLYHQWKFRLYRIMGAFLGRRRQIKHPNTVQAIHHQMLHWRRELPQRLRLETYNDEGDALLPQLQALSLQLTYDNLQIILHRTVAFKSDSREGRLRMTEAGSTSLQQLLDSAIDTSELYRYSSLLQASRRTHADMHIGITLFTAGVVLCAICLSQPLTEIGDRAKRGVMHIMRMCRSASLSPTTSQHLISRQSLSILDSLVTVVSRQETDLVTGRIDHPTVVGWSRQSPSPSTFAMPSSEAATAGTAPASSNSATISNSGERLLQPIQEVFAQHISGSTTHVPSPMPPANQLGTSAEAFVPSGFEAAASTFDWDGDLSVLVDQGLGDASQLWLWADNLGYETFNDDQNPR